MNYLLKKYTRNFEKCTNERGKLIQKRVTPADLFKPIDKILYINLEKRTDRRLQMEDQFKRLGIPPEKIARIEAVYEPTLGALGCTRSHIKCLETAIANCWKNVLILEDDFEFIPQHIYMNLTFLAGMTEPWDVIMFSANQRALERHNDLLARVRCALTTAGYLVNHHYFKTLLNNYTQSAAMLEQSRTPQLHALDVQFQLLQRTDRWFLFTHKMGFQRASFSDVENAFVDYRC